MNSKLVKGRKDGTCGSLRVVILADHLFYKAPHCYVAKTPDGDIELLKLVYVGQRVFKGGING